MRIGTLFSGGLAACEFALRYEDLEHEVVFACEWDKYARLQYLEFHEAPGAFYNDVSEMCGKKYLNTIDLMVWGSPCQDLSLAGKRKGFDGEKSSLFREGARIMSEVMPKAFIFENVKGLLSSNGGADYKEVVKTFQDMGYLIASKVVNAKEHGTAQNRERVFIVGFLDVDQYHAFNFAEPIPLTKVLRDYLEDEVDEKYYLSDEMVSKFVPGLDQLNPEYKSQGNTIHDIEKVAPTVCAGTHGYGMGYIKVPKLIIAGNLNTGSKYREQTQVFSLDSICPALLTMEGGNRQPKILLDNYRIRRLTPKECFRLQGVNDEDIKLINSDTQSYKIAGNAIEVNSMRMLIRQLYKPERKTNTLF